MHFLAQKVAEFIFFDFLCALMRRICFLFYLFLSAVSVWAYDFAEGGIYYAVTASDEVTVVAGEQHYEGYFEIPAEIRHEGVTYRVTSIGENAFCDCVNLVEVLLPATLESVGRAAFMGCSMMVNINLPEGVKTVADAAFYGCKGLYVMRIPSSLTFIGDEAFSRCDRLNAFDVSDDNPNYCDIDGVLMSKNATCLIAFPNRLTTDYIVPSGVTTIANMAFLNCNRLQSVSFPQSLTTIGDAAFYGCSALQSVHIPSSVERIGVWAFSECVEMKSVTLGEHVADIGEGAFSFCSQLQSIMVSSGNSHYTMEGGVLLTKDKTTLLACPGGKSGSYRIPTTVETIGNQAFYGCDSLESITLTEHLSQLGENPFVFCDSLEEIQVSNDHPGYTAKGGVLFNKEQTSILYYPNAKRGSYTIPDGVTSLQYGPFMRSRLLTSLTIPKGVKTIGDWTFLNCEGLHAVSLPSTLDVLGDQVFDSPLQYVFCGAAPMETKAFEADDFSHTTLYIPQGREDAYYQTSGWDVFGDYQTFGLTTPTQTLKAGQNGSLTICSGGAVHFTELEMDIVLPEVLSFLSSGESSYRIHLVEGVTGDARLVKTADRTYHLTIHCDDQRLLKGQYDPLVTMMVQVENVPEAFYNVGLLNISFSYSYQSLTGSAVQPVQMMGVAVVDGTGIQTIKASSATGPVFNLQGQCVRQSGESLKGLPTGVYIISGKKVLIGR